jgi:hypothetical protein
MAMNPPAMMTSRMKLGECGRFISGGSHGVGDGVPPAGETDFDAPVARRAASVGAGRGNNSGPRHEP